MNQSHPAHAANAGERAGLAGGEVLLVVRAFAQVLREHALADHQVGIRDEPVESVHHRRVGDERELATGARGAHHLCRLHYAAVIEGDGGAALQPAPQRAARHAQLGGALGVKLACTVALHQGVAETRFRMTQAASVNLVAVAGDQQAAVERFVDHDLVVDVDVENAQALFDIGAHARRAVHVQRFAALHLGGE